MNRFEFMQNIVIIVMNGLVKCVSDIEENTRF